MEIRCYDCGSTQFRRSRLRLSDLKRLLFLRYPVRCLSCFRRAYTSIPTAFSIRGKPLKKNAR
jgi:hypothetical protein